MRDALPDRILVLGATGFFGRSVAHGILDAGYQLRVLARNQASAGAFRVRGAEVQQGDAVDPGALAAACKDCAAVVSLVAVRANRPQTFIDVNIEAPRLLGEAAKAAGVHKVVYISQIGATPDALKSVAAADRKAYRKLVREFLHDNMLEAFAESLFFTRRLMRSEDEAVSWKASDGYMRFQSNLYRHRDRVKARTPDPRRAKSSDSSTRCWYCGCWAAFRSSDGFVVASWGRCSAMASMSPVSATTVV